ncbi:DUF6801 domain-containing protein [Streptomyces boncukensis]|uniref:DUF6801 domain-containing protein n=1 Tax=Streptomyces boncukensis TaxID=2711219 RepID=A0A6G4WSA1_9ACTN|nr:DUF6801 domain-containing protein [Streptomyces boncukensis]NGO67722.1 hypothetical protein [Streptomyces boncukensis]
MGAHGTRSRVRSALAAAAATGLAAGMLSAAGAGVAAAEPAELHQEYSCTFPLIGGQPITIDISVDLPSVVEVGETVPPFDIAAVSTVPKAAADGMVLVGGKTLEGTAIADVTVDSPQGGLDVKVPNDIEKTDIPNPTRDFEVNASGKSPQLQFGQPGEGKIHVNGIRMTDMQVRDANGEMIVFPGFPDGPFDADCKMTSSDTLLHSFTIKDGGGTDPSDPPDPGTDPADPSDPSDPTDPGPDPTDPGGDPTDPGSSTGNQDLNTSVKPDGQGGALTMTQAGDTVRMSPVTEGQGGNSTGDLQTVTVSDSRDGTSGWSLTGKATDFSGADTISAENLSWAPACTAAPGSAGSCVPGTDGVVGTEGATLATSPDGEDSGGEFTVGAGLDLEVPADAAPGDYASVLTLTLT